MQRFNRVLLRTGILGSRLYSSYVSRMRYLFTLKEEDEACRKAMDSGSIYLFHKLAPLLQKAEYGGYTTPAMQASDLKGILGKLGQNEDLLQESILIGCSESRVTQFALDLGVLEKESVESKVTGKFVELRKAFFLLNGHDLPLISQSQALLRWHQTHRYCSESGQLTQRNQAGSKRVCHANGAIYYPQMAPVVITLVSDGSRCLLARQASFAKGMYSALAGFCDVGETVEETVQREVAEEVGLEVESLWYTGSQHWPFPNSSLMMACHATVNPGQTQISVNSVELEDARWFSAGEVREALERKRPPRERAGRATPVWVPPRTAIANQLIREWANQQPK